MAAGKSKCFEAAQAVNHIMRLDSSDQEALLDVITDYFTAPDHSTDSDTSSEGLADSDSDIEIPIIGKITQ